MTTSRVRCARLRVRYLRTELLVLRIKPRALNVAIPRPIILSIDMQIYLRVEQDSAWTYDARIEVHDMEDCL